MDMSPINPVHVNLDRYKAPCSNIPETEIGFHLFVKDLKSRAKWIPQDSFSGKASYPLDFSRHVRLKDERGILSLCPSINVLNSLPLDGGGLEPAPSRPGTGRGPVLDTGVGVISS